jgi:hypothetical protein
VRWPPYSVTGEGASLYWSLQAPEVLPAALHERGVANPPVPEHHTDDETVLIASDVEDGQVAHHIRGRKRFADVLQALPFSLYGSIEPDLERRLRISVFRCSLEEAALADDIHDSILAKC